MPAPAKRIRNRNRQLTLPNTDAKSLLGEKADGTESRSLQDDAAWCVLRFGKVVFMTPILAAILAGYLDDHREDFDGS